MKYFLLLILSLVGITALQAQQKAVTENGEEVVLFDDGTWKYANGTLPVDSGLFLNPTTFTKSEQSTFLMKSKKFNVGFWVNPKEWSIKPASNNKDAEYEMELKKGDIYAMIITEKIEIPLISLKNIAFENAQNVAPDIKISKEEYRIVNGIRVLCLQMDGTVQGIKFSYFGYYYSNSNGTVQFITYSSKDILNKNIKACEQVLNGLVEIKP